MDISFGKTAYVSGTSREILDKMENSWISISATGNEIVVITKEAIEEYLQEYQKMNDYDKLQNRVVADFLTQALEAINNQNNDIPIGDIFFTT